MGRQSISPPSVHLSPLPVLTPLTPPVLTPQSISPRVPTIHLLSIYSPHRSLITHPSCPFSPICLYSPRVVISPLLSIYSPQPGLTTPHSPYPPLLSFLPNLNSPFFLQLYAILTPPPPFSFPFSTVITSPPSSPSIRPSTSATVKAPILSPTELLPPLQKDSNPHL